MRRRPDWHPRRDQYAIGKCAFSLGSGFVDDIRNIVPHADGFRRKGIKRPDHRNDDQRQDQRVFDSGRTFTVAQDCAQDFCHDLFPVFCSLVGGYELRAPTLRNC